MSETDSSASPASTSSSTRARRVYRRTRTGIRPYQRVGATLTAAAVAPLVPTKLDPVVTRTVSRLHLALAPGRQRKVAARMKRNLGTDASIDFDEAASDYWLQRVETRWGQARGISPTGWNPEVDLVGIEHLDAARACGRGTILWRVSGHCAIPLNQALADAGYPAVHLSRSDHLLVTYGGRFDTRVGPKVAPILRRGEDAPLLERVIFDDDTARSATRRLVEVLRANGLVTIVGDLPTGRRRHSVTVNAETFQFANGGAKLSLTTGAALLPVTVTRTAPLRYRIDVMPPLVAQSDVGRDTAAISLIEQFADVVADVIRRDPSQWPRWRTVTS